MNIWHDINGERIKKDDFVAVIEIQKNGRNKYELDKETGILKLDRILYTATHYPANYGFIPRTYAGDSDPLDVLVIWQEEIVPMTLVECYPIGVLKMIDNNLYKGIVAFGSARIPLTDPHVMEVEEIARQCALKVKKEAKVHTFLFHSILVINNHS